MQENQESPYRWVVIGLCALTAVCVAALPTMALSVLFDEISSDLGLTVVQVGIIWGSASFTGMLLGLVGGIAGDRFGPRPVLIVTCLGIGFWGAARGLSTGFTDFLVWSLLQGLFGPFLGVNLHNTARRWFSPSQLGFANGIIASGFAGGFLLGSALGATVFSPLLGGWRPVMFAFGAVACLFAVAWWVLIPATDPQTETSAPPSFFRETLPKVLKVRAVWLVAIGKIGVWGCIRGFTGYLPLYLRGIGWEPGLADAALSTFFVVSLLGAIPIPMLSDRSGRRKPFLIGAALCIGIGVCLMGFVTGGMIFLAAVCAGMLFDAFMGLSITIASETKSLGPALTGTAIGIIFFVADIGGTLAPPIGNALSEISPELPFFFWGGIALLGLIPFSMIREPASPSPEIAAFKS